MMIYVYSIAEALLLGIETRSMVELENSFASFTINDTVDENSDEE